MNVSTLALEVAKAEKLKKQVNIAQIKEVLRHAAMILASDEEALVKFLQYGDRNLAKKK
ncbi:MAG: hypothetical protein KA146_02250 [Leptospiraceae bacterium]|nr:hypothetical protein [Leptospiraceae bacterium]